MNKPLTQFRFLFGINLLFLFYGALFPFHSWRLPLDPVLKIVLFDWFDHIFLFDIIQNLLLFLPFGLLVGGYLILQERSRQAVLWLPLFAAFFISLFIEVWQTYNPARIPSLLDLLLNTISGFLGALGSPYLMRHYQTIHNRLQDLLDLSPQHRRWCLLGIGVWAAWAGSELYPFIPTLHPLLLGDGLINLYLSCKGEIPFDNSRFLLDALQGAMLFFAGKLFLKPIRFAEIVFAFVCLVFIAKLTMIEPQLNLETILGCLSAISILILLETANPLARRYAPPSSLWGRG